MKRAGNVKWWFEFHGTEGLFQFERQSRPEVYRFTGMVNYNHQPPLYAATHCGTFCEGRLLPWVTPNGLWVEEDRRVKTVNQTIEP